ncbi:hypothetical protein HOP50_10g57570 [Chloropicon primus]|uniref:Uncharacterized protein n=1 Tax=Chloropicon primus TaxID=1764295 RepID=A0A5B8MSH9_9CHLO|nr:hypothetical protein A3770_10p57350 [Chloropicon primus]UPR02431.1 hypothetical protein HOP50_10g57570 [Chloropicon primus]|eukprot:QDZ23217.1 hypothetical protein A3770_10p57350 [Chloropicon primus]
MKSSSSFIAFIVSCVLVACLASQTVEAARALQQGGGCPYGWNILAWLQCSTPQHSCTYEEVCRRCTYEDPGVGAAFWMRGSPLLPCWPGSTLGSTICLDSCGRDSFFCRLRCL